MKTDLQCSFIAALRCAAVALMFSLAGAAFAAYPDRPIRLVVPYAPGGSTDIAARIVGESLQKSLGVTVIIENRPGNSGFIGTSAVARAAPDGYTLLFAGNGIASAPSLKDMTFDLRKDLTPISRVVASSFLILINPEKVKANNLQELLDLVRANPGKFDFACSGAMTAAHFALEGFRQAAGLQFQTIQYSGNAPANNAMMAGEPPAGIDAAFSAKGAIMGGRLKALAVTGARRTPLLPDVPTASEAGVPGYSAGFSLVMLAPGATPKDIVNRINQAVVSGLKDPAVAKALEGQGYESVGNSAQEYAAELEEEIKQNAKIIEAFRAAGVVN